MKSNSLYLFGDQIRVFTPFDGVCGGTLMKESGDTKELVLFDGVDELLESIDEESDAERETLYSLAPVFDDGHGLSEYSVKGAWHCDAARPGEFGGVAGCRSTTFKQCSNSSLEGSARRPNGRCPVRTRLQRLPASVWRRGVALLRRAAKHGSPLTSQLSRTARCWRAPSSRPVSVSLEEDPPNSWSACVRRRGQPENVGNVAMLAQLKFIQQRLLEPRPMGEALGQRLPR